MTFNEHAVSFNVGKEICTGIIHSPLDYQSTAVLVVVGGPQYRVGSHRQFVQLSRAMARQGIPSMRFDYSGMGDSSGLKKTFDKVCDDIEVAIDVLMKELQGVRNVVIWGLCDAASAALMYAPKDKRVSGLVILNPWLRSEQSTAKTMLKYYYLKKLFNPVFWKKLIKGGVNISQSVKEVSSSVSDLSSGSKEGANSYQSRMADGFNRFNKPICLILSGDDLTASEFVVQTENNKLWKALDSKHNRTINIDDADHTFSQERFKRQVEDLTCDFVRSL